MKQTSKSVNFIYMDYVRSQATRSGSHFFSKNTMKFFQSKVATRKAFSNDDKTFYFVTSENAGFGNSRRSYTIRAYDINTCKISTFGSFQEYDNLNEAKKAIMSFLV
jgi:hypothetical protein